MKNTKKRGFTIVELVIVIAVIAILASVLIPTFSDIVTKAKKTAALQDARNAYTQALVEHLDESTACGEGVHTIGDWTVQFTGDDAATVSGEVNGEVYTFNVNKGKFTPANGNAGGTGNNGGGGNAGGGNAGGGQGGGTPSNS